jgi:hypothetical protein
MTWIVKATGGYEYVCHPDGDIFGPDLSDAYRYAKREKAARVAAKLNRSMIDGKPYRAVRLRRSGDRMREELAALRTVRDAAWQLVDGAAPIPPKTRRKVCATLECYQHEVRDLRLALAALPVSRKEREAP